MRCRSRRLVQVIVTGVLFASILTGCSSTGSPGSVGGGSPSSSATAVPAGSRALFFGDSWTAGYGVPSGSAFPYATAKTLSWRPIVEGSPGSGYLAALTSSTRSYPVRATRLKPQAGVRVIVLQGGINDAALPSRQGLQAAMRLTIGELSSVYPGVPILMLGPASTSGTPSTQLLQVDGAARAAARDAGIAYVSPVAEDWVNALNARAVISAENEHPTVAGQAYLAQRLVNDIRLLEQSGRLTVPRA